MDAKHGHDVTARGPIDGPARRVEKREALLGEPVTSLYAASEPFSEMLPDAESFPQFVLVVFYPTRETVVVILGRNPASARTGEHAAVLRDDDLRIRPVDFFSNDDGATKARDLRERHEWNDERDRNNIHDALLLMTCKQVIDREKSQRRTTARTPIHPSRARVS